MHECEVAFTDASIVLPGAGYPFQSKTSACTAQTFTLIPPAHTVAFVPQLKPIPPDGERSAERSEGYMKRKTGGGEVIDFCAPCPRSASSHFKSTAKL